MDGWFRVSNGVLMGWVCDPQTPAQTMDVDIYVDGPGANQGGTFIKITDARINSDPGVANVCGGQADHSVSIDLKPFIHTANLPSGNYPVYALGVRRDGTGAVTEIKEMRRESGQTSITVDNIMCAVVRNNNNQLFKTYCDAEENTALTCRSTGAACNVPVTANQGAWYQKALDEANTNGFKNVTIDAGTIVINDSTKLNAGWPLNGSGIGLHVPTGTRLSGSTNRYHPTYIKVDAGASPLDAVVAIAADRSDPEQPVGDAEVSYLNIIGASEQYSQCDHVGTTFSSILDLDAYPPAVPSIQPVNRDANFGVWVAQSTATHLPVNVHHMKISNVNTAINYGWNTAVQKEDGACQTTSCLKINITSSTSGCGRIESLSIDNQPAANWCVTAAKTPSCTSENYCYVKPHEFVGNASSPSYIYNNSICNVGSGINVVGGYTRVHHNVIMRQEDEIGNSGQFGISADGHTPYSTGTQFYENYVYGFRTAFLTDGSQYVVVDPTQDFPQIVSLNGSSLAASRLTGANDYNIIKQYIFDGASEWLAQAQSMRGYIDNPTVRDNRLIVSPRPGAMGVSLYRANWAYVGFNKITTTATTSSPGFSGVNIDNTINSWIYGNYVGGYSNGIRISGNPGKQSFWGSCWNGVDTYFNANEPEGSPNRFVTHLDTFNNNACNIKVESNQCFSAALPGRCSAAW